VSHSRRSSLDSSHFHHKKMTLKRVTFLWWSESDGAGGYNTIGIPSEMPAFTLGEDWIKGSDDTYYYRLPVAPNASTKDLLGSDMTLTEKQGYLQVVDVFAEAIQSLPEEAVTTSWKVTLDDDGNIATVQ